LLAARVGRTTTICKNLVAADELRKSRTRLLHQLVYTIKPVHRTANMHMPVLNSGHLEIRGACGRLRYPSASIVLPWKPLHKTRRLCLSTVTSLPLSAVPNDCNAKTYMCGCRQAPPATRTRRNRASLATTQQPRCQQLLLDIFHLHNPEISTPSHQTKSVHKRGCSLVVERRRGPLGHLKTSRRPRFDFLAPA
jgi:hypothetical protein